LPAPHRLAEYAVQAVTAGIDAIGEVHVRVEAGTRIFLGRAGTTDIVVASARAYVDALNRLIAAGPSALAARQTPEQMAASTV
jgi:2-isopropylmalate synthase